MWSFRLRDRIEGMWHLARLGRQPWSPDTRPRLPDAGSLLSAQIVDRDRQVERGLVDNRNCPRGAVGRHILRDESPKHFHLLHFRTGNAVPAGEYVTAGRAHARARGGQIRFARAVERGSAHYWRHAATRGACRASDALDPLRASGSRQAWDAWDPLKAGRSSRARESGRASGTCRASEACRACDALDPLKAGRSSLARESGRASGTCRASEACRANWADRAGESGCASEACRANWTCQAGESDRAGEACRAGESGEACRTGESDRANGADSAGESDWASGTSRASESGRAGGTSRASESGRAGGTRRAGESDWANETCLAGEACHTGGPSRAGESDWANETCLAGQSDRASGTSRAGESGLANGTRLTAGSGRANGTGRTSRSGCANGTRRASGTCRPSGSSGTCRPSGSSGSSGAGQTFRRGRSGRKSERGPSCRIPRHGGKADLIRKLEHDAAYALSARRPQNRIDRNRIAQSEVSRSAVIGNRQLRRIAALRNDELRGRQRGGGDRHDSWKRHDLAVRQIEIQGEGVPRLQLGCAGWVLVRNANQRFGNLTCGGNVRRKTYFGDDPPVGRPCRFWERLRMRNGAPKEANPHHEGAR